MANLIITPTDGGSLILQDEGGDAAVTVGTTGDVALELVVEENFFTE